ncbi:MAG: dipeptidase [Alkalilacustris sp.]
MAQQAVFDGHNDVLLKLWEAGDRTGAGFFDGLPGHLDIGKCRAGDMGGGLFAIWVRGPKDALPPEDDPEPVFGPLDPGAARVTTLEMAAILIRMARARPDALRLCTDTAQIAAAEAAGALAVVMHLEGAEGIGPDLDELHVLHAAGLRSIGPVWSRDNIFGHGVPFRFPSSPDTGPGLTDAGRRLVREAERLGMVIDLSHISEAGFDDIAGLTEGPLVASHSGAHALCPCSRNLTDRQLAMIAERGGLVGLNLAVQFLRADGVKEAATPLEDVLRHLDHLLVRLGEGGVALGSDFDGAVVPQAIGSAAGLPALVEAMRAAGYGDRLVARICHDNWVDLLRRVIG